MVKKSDQKQSSRGGSSSGGGGGGGALQVGDDQQDRSSREVIVRHAVTGTMETGTIEYLAREGKINKNGRFQGKGTFTYSDGSIYKGNFKDGRHQGKGTFTKQDVMTYEGYFKDGFHGEGILKLQDGTIYEGNFEKCKRHGKGKWIHPDGTTYEGQWKDDKINGKGIFKYLKGGIYEGEWKDDKRHGEGTYTYADGDFWKGKFKDDKQYKGLMFVKNGDKYDIYEEDWDEEGRLITSIKRDADKSMALFLQQQQRKSKGIELTIEKIIHELYPQFQHFLDGLHPIQITEDDLTQAGLTCATTHQLLVQPVRSTRDSAHHERKVYVEDYLKGYEGLNQKQIQKIIEPADPGLLKKLEIYQKLKELNKLDKHTKDKKKGDDYLKLYYFGSIAFLDLMKRDIPEEFEALSDCLSDCQSVMEGTNTKKITDKLDKLDKLGKLEKSRKKSAKAKHTSLSKHKKQLDQLETRLREHFEPNKPNRYGRSEQYTSTMIQKAKQTYIQNIQNIKNIQGGKGKQEVVKKIIDVQEAKRALVDANAHHQHKIPYKRQDRMKDPEWTPQKQQQLFHTTLPSVQRKRYKVEGIEPDWINMNKVRIKNATKASGGGGGGGGGGRGSKSSTRK